VKAIQFDAICVHLCLLSVKYCNEVLDVVK